MNNRHNSPDNNLEAKIKSALSQIKISIPVAVLSVDIKRHCVDLRPLTTMKTQNGERVDYGPMHNIPYIRLQAGGCGVIIDPKIGDKGLAVFAARDISNLDNTEIPASNRMFSMSDAIYIASLLYEEPKTYIKITDDLVEIKASQIKINGNVEVSGDVIADGISLKQHVHGNGYNGENTGEPIG